MLATYLTYHIYNFIFEFLKEFQFSLCVKYVLKINRMCLIIKIRFYRNFLLPGPLDNLFCCCCNISSRQQVPLTKKTFSTLSHFRGNEQQVNCYSLKAFYIIEYFCFFIFLVSMYFSLKLREVLILDEKECLKSVCYNDFMI